MHASAVAIPSGRRRWVIAWLLGIGVLVNYLDRVNLSVSHDALSVSFGVTDIVFGYLSGAYNWTYALLQLPMGRLLDRFGVRRIGCASIGVWSVASFLAALSPGTTSFFGARLLLGIGEAPTFPANAKAIGIWFPRQERSLATAVFDAAAKFASAIGVPVLGLLLLEIGWRWSFAVTGLISVGYLFAFAKIYREPEHDSKLTGAELAYIQRDVEGGGSNASFAEEKLHSESIGYLLSRRKVLALALGMGSYNYVFYLLLTWLPSYLSSALHIDLVHSFLYTGVPWLVATVTDLLGGWSVDRMIRRGWDPGTVRKTALILGLIFGLGLLGAADAHTPLRALGWISVSIGGLAAAAPVGWSLPALISPRRDVGTVGGIVNFANQLSGIAAPVLTGYCVAATHQYQWAFRIAAGYLLIGIASYLFLFGKVEPFAPSAVTAT